MAVLPDHDHLMIIGERDDVDPVSRFYHIEVMLHSSAGRDGGIRPYGENTVRSSGL
jgi:hypothetical protein